MEHVYVTETQVHPDNMLRAHIDQNVCPLEHEVALHLHSFTNL